MRTFFALWRREFAALFLSPIAYMMLMFFLLVTGAMFCSLIGQNQEVMSSIEGLMFVIWGSMLIVVPILTMRTFSEERKSGTFETLMTAPVNDAAVVAAKFAGVLSFFILMCAPTALYVLVIHWIAPESTYLVDTGVLLGGYLMISLIASTFIALGILASALTSNQIIAAISTFSIMSILFLGGLYWEVLVKTPAAQDVGRTFTSAYNLMRASRGVFDTRSLIFNLTTTLFFLFATTKAVSARR